MAFKPFKFLRNLFARPNARQIIGTQHPKSKLYADYLAELLNAATLAERAVAAAKAGNKKEALSIRRQINTAPLGDMGREWKQFCKTSADLPELNPFGWQIQTEAEQVNIAIRTLKARALEYQALTNEDF